MKDSSGNILFLILIAVALFAALSYAVTTSTRGTGRDASQESGVVNSAAVQQYTASVRGAVTRLIVNEAPVLGLEFNPPADFSNLTSPSVGVFHPAGGSIIFQTAPPDVMDANADNPTGQWVFTLNAEVKDVGISSAGNLDGNDLMALLIGVKKSVCEQINAKLGLLTSPIPILINGQLGESMIGNLTTYYMDNDYVLPTDEQVIGAGVADSALAGKQEGCFYESDEGDYVYYSVIIPR